MEKVLDKLDNVKKTLEEDERIKRIKELNRKVKEDKELVKLLEEYKYNKKENIKEEIINNELFQEYKKSEIDINILIMEINQKLKEINKKGSCTL